MFVAIKVKSHYTFVSRENFNTIDIKYYLCIFIDYSTILCICKYLHIELYNIIVYYANENVFFCFVKAKKSDF